MCHDVDIDGCNRVPGHFRRARVDGILDDSEAAAALDRPESGRAVIELSTEHDANHPRPVMLGGGAKERIDGGPRPVFLRSDRQMHVRAIEQQMPVGGSDDDAPRLDGFAVDGFRDAQSSVGLENVREHSGAFRRDVPHDKNRRGQICGERAHQLLNRFVCAGRTANADDVSHLSGR
jgi:hypothetical protein